MLRSTVMTTTDSPSCPTYTKNRLELFYVCSGNGQVYGGQPILSDREGRYRHLQSGRAARREPEQVRQIRSYSVALTGVQVVRGLPPNCLIAAGENRWCPCGQLAAQVGETMRLLYCSVGYGQSGCGMQPAGRAMLDLTDALLCSRVQQREKRRQSKIRLCWRIACGVFWIPIIGSRSLCVWWPSSCA